MKGIDVFSVPSRATEWNWKLHSPADGRVTVNEVSVRPVLTGFNRENHSRSVGRLQDTFHWCSPGMTFRTHGKKPQAVIPGEVVSLCTDISLARFEGWGPESKTQAACEGIQKSGFVWRRVELSYALKYGLLVVMWCSLKSHGFGWSLRISMNRWFYWLSKRISKRVRTWRNFTLKSTPAPHH